MKQIYVSTRGLWRRWLVENHARCNGGIWLVFYKHDTGKPTLKYEETVVEALCFGWIVTAKPPKTRAKRLNESLVLLAKGEKLELK